MQDSVPMWVYEYKKKRVKEMLKNLAKGHHQITGKYINSKPMIVSPHDKK